MKKDNFSEGMHKIEINITHLGFEVTISNNAKLYQCDFTEWKDVCLFIEKNPLIKK